MRKLIVMKNLTILFVLMLSSSIYSQDAKFLIFVNADSAIIKIDNKVVGFARTDTSFIVPVSPGKHQVSASWGRENLKSQKIKINAGESLELEFEFAEAKKTIPNDSWKDPVIIETEKLIESINFQEGSKEDSVFSITEEPTTSQDDSTDSPVFLVTEEPATFQGGDLGKFNIWVSQNVRYPQEAVVKGIKGKVYLQFIVNEKGKVERTKLLRGVHSSLDQEAIRVVMSSPLWIPARQAGKTVKQLFTLPIVFMMN